MKKAIAMAVALMCAALVGAYRTLTRESGEALPVAAQNAVEIKSGFENSLGMKFSEVAGTDALFCRWPTRVRDFRVFVGDRANNGGYDYRSGTQPYILKSDRWKRRGWDCGWDRPGFAQTEDHPVVCASWADAKAFCAWLTKTEREAGRLDDRWVYRLPYDREWSLAAGLNERKTGTPEDRHAKISDVYLWGAGSVPPAGWGNFGGEEVRNADWPPEWETLPGHRDDYARTSPVCEFGARHGALCDLGGNIWEWCEDFANGKDGSRTLRGGSWFSSRPEALLASYRFQNLPGVRFDCVGFRIVLAPKRAVVATGN